MTLIQCDSQRSVLTMTKKTNLTNRLDPAKRRDTRLTFLLHRRCHTRDNRWIQYLFVRKTGSSQAPWHHVALSMARMPKPIVHASHVMSGFPTALVALKVREPVPFMQVICLFGLSVFLAICLNPNEAALVANVAVT